MKRKRPHPSFEDIFLSISPTIERIETVHDEIIAGRDFTGIPYKIFVSLGAMRYESHIIRHMILSRATFAGKRTFIADDGHVLALDVNYDDSGDPRVFEQTTWFHDGQHAHLLEIFR